jgi:diadenosine tetraphosphate (Ap4A) HIT family hydrolase
VRRARNKFLITEGRFCSIFHCNDVAVPGYLILVVNSSARRLEKLQEPAAFDVMRHIRLSLGVIRTVTEAEKIYVFLLNDGERPLHFHLFPQYNRMKKTLKALNKKKVDGAELLCEARRVYATTKIQDTQNAVASTIEEIRKNWLSIRNSV